jgi:hypothetical protein
MQHNTTSKDKKVASRSSRRVRTGPQSGNTLQYASDDTESEMVRQPFLSADRSSSSRSATAANATRALVGRLYQGLAQKFRKKKNRDHYHHHAHGQQTDDSIRVNVPIRMMFSTLAIFLVLPLSLFIWKEMHLHPATTGVEFKPNLRKENRDGPDRFPTWMDKVPALSVDVKKEGQVHETTTSNGTKDNTTMTTPHLNSNKEEDVEQNLPEEEEQNKQGGVESSGDATSGDPLLVVTKGTSQDGSRPQDRIPDVLEEQEHLEKHVDVIEDSEDNPGVQQDEEIEDEEMEEEEEEEEEGIDELIELDNAEEVRHSGDEGRRHLQ